MISLPIIYKFRNLGKFGYEVYRLIPHLYSTSIRRKLTTVNVEGLRAHYNGSAHIA